MTKFFIFAAYIGLYSLVLCFQFGRRYELNEMPLLILIFHANYLLIFVMLIVLFECVQSLHFRECSNYLEDFESTLNYKIYMI